jgi:isoamylase
MQFKALADPDATVGIPRQEAWMDRPVAAGRSYPLGATLRDGGVNFSVFSKDANRVELCLFDHVDDARPARVIALDPRTHRTYHYWHVFVRDVAPGQLYAFRVQGLFDPANGLRFDASKVLLDPYGKCIARPAAWSRQAAYRPGDNAATAFKSVVVDPTAMIGRTMHRRAIRSSEPSSTRCMSAGSRDMRAPGWPPPNAAPMPA